MKTVSKYPQNIDIQILNKLRKRITLQQLIKFDENRIKKQFQILNQLEFINEKELFYQPKSMNYRNRYIDILVYNHSKIRCKSNNKDIQSDQYVNANIMKSIINQQPYAIFAQAPTPAGFNAFWKAIYDNDLPVVIMLCSFYDPKRGQQSEQYWPKLNTSHIFKTNTSQIEVINEKETILDQDYKETTFRMIGQNGQKILKHYHWKGWSDLKKPLGKDSQKTLKGLIEISLELIKEKKIFMIHCSAGIGRTGTLGTMIEAIRCLRDYKKLSIFQIVENMRLYRIGTVQSYQQYKFVYQEIKDYYEMI